MKNLALLCVGVGTLFLGGCGILPNDPGIVGRSERWYRHTDPAAFFAHEQSRDRVYFVGIYDPAAGADSPVPGVRRKDPAYRVARTWFVPSNSIPDPERNRRFVEAAREFARRYNPLVLAYLKQQPVAK